MCGENCVFGCCKNRKNRSVPKRICEMQTCRFAYSHYYAAGLCGPINDGTGKQPAPRYEINSESVEAASVAVDRYTQAVEEAKSHVTVHMLASEFGVACTIKLDDGYEHQITSDFKKVTCKGCRLKYGEYVMREQEELLARQAAQILEKDEELSSARAVTTNLRKSLEDTEANLRYAKNSLAASRNEVRRLAHRNRRLSEEVQAHRGSDPYVVHRVDRYGNRY